MKKLTLIGGAPGTGKTTLSQRIAREEGAVELSTDSIRGWMRRIIPLESNTDLHYKTNLTIEEYYEQHQTPESAMQGEIAEGKQVQHGIVALLSCSLTWEHLVIEGIAITPEFILQIQRQFTDREVDGYILHSSDSTLDTRIRTRGLWGDIGSYPTSYNDKEVPWVLLYNAWFKEQALKHNVRIVET